MPTLEMNDLTVNESNMSTVILNDTSVSVGNSVDLTANDSSTLLGTATNVVATDNSTIDGTATNVTLQDSAALTGDATNVVATDNSTIDGTATNVTLQDSAALTGDATNVVATDNSTIDGTATNVTLDGTSTLNGIADNVVAGEQTTITGIVNENLTLIGADVAVDSTALILATVTTVEPPIITQQPQDVNTVLESALDTKMISLSVSTTTINPTFTWLTTWEEGGVWFDYSNLKNNQTITPLPEQTIYDGNTTTSVIYYQYFQGGPRKRSYFKVKVSKENSFIYSDEVQVNFDLALNLPTLPQISASNTGIINIEAPYFGEGCDIQWQYSYDNSTWIDARKSLENGLERRLITATSELTQPNNTYFRYKAKNILNTAYYSNSVQLFIPNTNTPKIKIIYPSKKLYLFSNQSRVLTLNVEITENQPDLVYWGYYATAVLDNGYDSGLGSAATNYGVTINSAVHTYLSYYRYIVARAYNQFGHSVSNILECVYDSPPVLTDPAEYEVFADNNGNFTVNASFENADTIEWFYYNSNRNTWDSLLTESVVNKTSHSITRNAYDFMPANATLKYVLTNIIGSITSRERVVRVIHTVLPTFVTQPIDIGYVLENAQGTYTFTASAINSVRIDWETSNYPDEEYSWYTTERSTNTLVVPISTCNRMRWYRARAINTTGSVVSLTASLGILVAPQFQTNLYQPIVSPTGSFTLSVNQLYGSTITWQTKLENELDWTNIFTENVATKFNPTYTGNVNDFPGNRTVRCVVTNDIGTVTSNAVELDPNYGKVAPEFTQQPQLDQYTTAEISFKLSATVINSKTLTWQIKYELPLGNSNTLTTDWESASFNAPFILINPLSWPQNTKLYYRCIANNKYGSTISDVVSTTIFKNNLDFTIYNYYAAEEATEGYNQRLQVPYVFKDNKCAFVVYSLSYGNQTVYPSQIIWQGSIDGATGWTDMHTSNSYDYPAELGNSLLYQDYFVNSSYNQPTLFGGELVTIINQQPIYNPTWSNAFVYLLDVVNDTASYNYIRFRVPNEIGLPLYSNSVKLVKSNVDRLPKFVTQPPSNLGTIIIETEEIIDPNDNTLMSWRYKKADLTLSTSFTNTEQYSGVMSPSNFMFWEISSVWFGPDMNIIPSGYLMTEDPSIAQTIAEQQIVGYKDTAWTATSIHLGIMPSSTYNIRPVVCNPYGRANGNYCNFTILNEPLLTNKNSIQSVISGNFNSQFGIGGYQIIASKINPNTATYASEITVQYQYTQDINNTNSYPWTNIGNEVKLLSGGVYYTFNTLTDILYNNTNDPSIGIYVRTSTFPNSTGRLAFRVKYSDASTQGKYSRPVKFTY